MTMRGPVLPGDESHFETVDDDQSESSPSPSRDESSRDEVKAIKQEASRDSFRVYTWRLFTTMAILFTAAAVTWTTHRLLKDSEQDNFETAFERFSGTVEDAAQIQMEDIQKSIETLSHSVSIQTESSGANWPYVIMPDFEQVAQDFLRISDAEFVGFNNVVYRQQRKNYTEWMNSGVYKDFVEEANVIAFGNLGQLDTDASKYKPFITRRHSETRAFVEDTDRDVYFPRTTQSPPASSYGGTINWNAGSVGSIGIALNMLLTGGENKDVRFKKTVLVSEVRPFQAFSSEAHDRLHDGGSGVDHPHSFVYAPVHKSIHDATPTVVATITAAIAWDTSLRNLLPDEVRGLVCVIRNSCGQSYTYLINGVRALYQGEGDLHDGYDDMRKEVALSWNTEEWFVTTPGHCIYSMDIYPSPLFEESYKTNTPRLFAIVVASTFVLITIVFFVYDVMVQRRNEALVKKAAQSSEIVSSLFPGHLRQRILEETHVNKAISPNDLKTYLHDRKDTNGQEQSTRPIADLYLNTTVMFADLVGFTAWSSTREPGQVFTLLETLYSAFDAIAKKRRVFKVETVGDCYVAVAGLPDPRSDHATAMARFARDCVLVTHRVTQDLEKKLGPDTTDLLIRVGIHSGPVTAGVLRGERSRFQLFGDTMNTCARMESTSVGNRIHVSEETARLLQGAGKGGWLQKRSDRVEAKGKGLLTTHWLNLTLTNNSSSSDKSTSHPSDRIREDNLDGGESPAFDRRERLIDWNVEVLSSVLKQIIARRQGCQSNVDGRSTPSAFAYASGTTIPLDEVKEIIALPDYHDESATVDEVSVVIPQEVDRQLRKLVSCVCALYRDNPFHNFEHASHVVSSVAKLMSRIVASEAYGITSDPLTQFACIFSALIHDIDHLGIPNTRLCVEKPEMASAYQYRSVAEQNSFEIAWSLLAQDDFAALRAALCPAPGDFSRFRQLVVNIVLATDIMDKQLKELRNNRWDKAFQDDDDNDVSATTFTTPQARVDDRNRKATIVIEHLIQASDVAHTMQHWHVYRKWNERLFFEMYRAYVSGRADKDPSEFWYKGEMGFFDFYIIPLAEKLKECGVFGVSSGEYLTYATNNRAEWEAKGQSMVAEYMEKLASHHQQQAQQSQQDDDDDDDDDDEEDY